MPLKKFLKKSKKALDKVRDKVKSFRQKSAEEDKDIKKVKLPKKNLETMTVEISLWSSVKIILIVLGFLVLQEALVQITDILLIFFISLFLAAAFNPGVDWLEQKLRIPRAIGIILFYILVIGILSFIIGGVVPIIITQISDMAVSLKDYLNNFIKSGNADGGILSRFKPNIEKFINEINIESLQQYLQTIASNLASFAGNALGIALKVVNGIFNFILILLLTFFMVAEKNELNRFFTSLFPKKYEKYIFEKAHRVQVKIGEWVHGQMALFAIMGLLTFIGLTVIGIIAVKTAITTEASISKYALTLALVAGIAEFLPYLGPMFAFATAAPVAFNDSWIVGIIVIGFYSFLQLLEGNIIVPLVMRKAVGLSPIVTIIAMLVGWQFLGMWGMILSIPIASILAIFVGDFTTRQSR